MEVKTTDEIREENRKKLQEQKQKAEALRQKLKEEDPSD
jgi:hypothetical protein